MNLDANGRGYFFLDEAVALVAVSVAVLYAFSAYDEACLLALDIESIAAVDAAKPCFIAAMATSEPAGADLATLSRLSATDF